jgi:hypothetical protein
MPTVPPQEPSVAPPAFHREHRMAESFGVDAGGGAFTMEYVTLAATGLRGDRT